MVTVWGGFIPPQVRRIAVKLNNRRTILVGLAFLSICTFWQMYDSVMTLILTDTFKLNETFAGAIMQRTMYWRCSCCRFLVPCPTGPTPKSGGVCRSLWVARPPQPC